MKQERWPQSLVNVIAKEVRRHRERRGMSAQKLADRCSELGYPIARNTLSNLENGVAELLVLADALQVPPLFLVMPIGRADWVEVLPGVEVDPFKGLRWAAGEAPLPGSESPVSDEFRVLDRYRIHHSQVRSRLIAQQKMADLPADEKRHRRRLRYAIAEAEDMLGYLRLGDARVRPGAAATPRRGGTRGRLPRLRRTGGGPRPR